MNVDKKQSNFRNSRFVRYSKQQSMEGNRICEQLLLENNKSILSVILDLNIDSWILREKYTLSNDNVSVEFTECLEAILAFINSFILQNHHNQLVVSVYGNGKPY